ncbi:MAG: ABC transporter ATP-binding protein [Solirubrobacterales bacterium]|nr:ABC transporter ATP-binding protein [Solirubrobacterales bacterium]
MSDLTVGHPGDPGQTLVEGLSFEIEPGETHGLIGPSGSGKTVTALTLLGLGPGGTRFDATGSIRLLGRELIGLAPKQWRSVRGSQIGFVPQDPGTSLTPVRRVGDLLAEVISAHAPAPDRRARAIELLGEVGFPDPEKVAHRFAHELSGGQQQRVAIAAAIAAEPELLVADEPTSSLDVITRDRIMDLLASIQARRSMAMLLISHDRRELAERADRVSELRDGRLVRTIPGDRLTSAEGWSSPPTRRTERTRETGRAPRLRLTDLEMTFPAGRGSPPERAVRGVDLEVHADEAVGLVGVTGSGKSTLALCATRLAEPTGGRVEVEGQDITHLPQRRIREQRSTIGMVFQNPTSSLNPRRRAGATIEAPLRAGREGEKADRRERVLRAARSARLDPLLLDRMPSELSGGQQQRVALARALVTDPTLLILDEPFTALDEEIELELCDLLVELREERGLAVLLITHDMRLVARMADRVAVMSAGVIVEEGDTETVLSRPREEITRQLISASRAHGSRNGGGESRAPRSS